MNTRPLTATESENLAALNRSGKPSALLFLTVTGLKKSILDATEPLRRMLREANVHDYVLQGQGEKHKRLLPALILEDAGIFTVTSSLYRPKTKKGDPRIWFSTLGKYAAPDDVCAVFAHNKVIHVINLTRTPLAAILETVRTSPLKHFFKSIFAEADAVSSDLLHNLRAIAAQGPIKAVCRGSTAIGRSIESMLGIPINSSKQPDYKGIEIKAGRALLSANGKITKSKNRATLFACVPDWDLSRCKSSKQILDEFGYARDGDFKLYCTVSTRIANSQGLVFEYNDAERWLKELHRGNTPKDVAVWRMNRLEQRLMEKHRETFWISARTIIQAGHEYFDLLSVTHTRNPNIPQLERMLCNGQVTMDHLIKRVRNNAAHEKGPLFKIGHLHIPELFFGKPQQYQLQ